MMLFRCAAMLALALCISPDVRAQELSVEIAAPHIDVTVGFNGSSIQVFGDKRDEDADIAVYVIGPEKTLTVWERSPVLGAWVNRYYAHFTRQPALYRYAVSFDEEEALRYSTLMLENRIGVDALFYEADIKLSRKNDDKSRFIAALVNEKIRKGFFPKESAPIKFLNDHFFRIDFDIPPSAPTGEYKIHSLLIKDGKITEADIDVIKVEQVGLNAFILRAAREHGLSYAFICILIAGFAGWLVNALKVRP